MGWLTEDLRINLVQAQKSIMDLAISENLEEAWHLEKDYSKLQDVWHQTKKLIGDIWELDTYFLDEVNESQEALDSLFLVVEQHFQNMNWNMEFAIWALEQTPNPGSLGLVVVPWIGAPQPSTDLVGGAPRDPKGAAREISIKNLIAIYQINAGGLINL